MTGLDASVLNVEKFLNIMILVSTKGPAVEQLWGASLGVCVQLPLGEGHLLARLESRHPEVGTARAAESIPEVTLEGRRKNCHAQSSYE